MPGSGQGKEKRRSRGRPRGEPSRDVRAALLAAARERFLHRPYRDVSVRELAAAAGVNPAMVGYYFRDKEGLYADMLREVVAPLMQRIEAMLATPAGRQPDLGGLLREYMHVIAAHPWLPRLILRDVLAADGAFRDRFMAEFAGRIAPRIAALAGRHAPDNGQDPRLVVVSMFSLGMWPFLAMPILQRALEFEPDAAGIERLVEHTVKFFEAGLSAGDGT